MDKKTFEMIAELRLLIGFLGEKAQFSWWGSTFFSSQSQTFLSPIFPRTVLLSQYRGVCEAAMRVHDEYIGLGSHYHLYRLPEALEQAISKVVLDNRFGIDVKDELASKQAAIKRLNALVDAKDARLEGPLAVGEYKDKQLKKLSMIAAENYLGAFTNDYRCFPFFRGQ